MPAPARQAGATPDSSLAALPTRERIRHVAADLFGRRGYTGTSVAEIAAGVGIRKASLYAHYASKEELLMELFEESLAAWREASGPALEGPGPLELRLREHVEAAVGFAARHPMRVAIIRVAATQIGGDLGHRIGRRLATHREEYVARLERHFAAALAAGEIADGDPEDLALGLRAFLDGLLSNLLFRVPDAGRFLERLPRLWRLVWRGLGGRPGGGEA